MKKIILIFVLILFFLFATGCISQNDDYSVEVEEITKEDGINNVKLVITNHESESIKLKFKTHGIVYDDGSQVGIHNSLLLPTKYYTITSKEYARYFTILPNAKKQFNLAFKEINKDGNPQLVVSFVDENEYETEFVISLNEHLN
ncbi:hypothetical protein [Methanococcoides seepicolus]|jgi:hypothetical protein|uniref:Uncharacterized protein n=1 Tax=Methanococcoides seepicolus TaxID=2828780 RepID=A0A9E4ZHD2_9EURY|nr:hypothetical protein [Methanococcoides seepicolus]MCM1987692.1 hypothetical protein [Methanococcoides seepicolus]